ncbi:hypothetical protein [Azospirillum isscasi]|uniref:Uncharacterized protein n=1 Tax=Azospirillum isscasi TaxID=3053926 RepID=A0ABU0WR22_9PROT|nr:hypothetical protein [Azospirillum isscasi]MDQ2106700.1 hypothetical protein [Azospirillum isscasi]
MTTPVRIGPEFLVNTTTAHGQYASNVAALTNGDFVVSRRHDLISVCDPVQVALEGTVMGRAEAHQCDEQVLGGFRQDHAGQTATGRWVILQCVQRLNAHY